MAYLPCLALPDRFTRPIDHGPLKFKVEPIFGFPHLWVLDFSLESDVLGIPSVSSSEPTRGPAHRGIIASLSSLAWAWLLLIARASGKGSDRVRPPAGHTSPKKGASSAAGGASAQVLGLGAFLSGQARGKPRSNLTILAQCT